MYRDAVIITVGFSIGWDEAVTKMKLNEKAKLTITPCVA